MPKLLTHLRTETRRNGLLLGGRIRCRNSWTASKASWLGEEVDCPQCRRFMAEDVEKVLLNEHPKHYAEGNGPLICWHKATGDVGTRTIVGAEVTCECCLREMEKYG